MSGSSSSWHLRSSRVSLDADSLVPGVRSSSWINAATRMSACRLIRRILSELPAAEVIVTIAADALFNFMNTTPRFLRSIGRSAVPWRSSNKSLARKGAERQRSCGCAASVSPAHARCDGCGLRHAVFHQAGRVEASPLVRASFEAPDSQGRDDTAALGRASVRSSTMGPRDCA